MIILLFDHFAFNHCWFLLFVIILGHNLLFIDEIFGNWTHWRLFIRPLSLRLIFFFYDLKQLCIQKYFLLMSLIKFTILIGRNIFIQFLEIQEWYIYSAFDLIWRCPFFTLVILNTLISINFGLSWGSDG